MPFRLRSLVAVLCCGLSWVALADERILDYRSDIRIDANGELTVTEMLRVRAEGRDIQRGIYRDFPTNLCESRIQKREAIMQ